MLRSDEKQCNNKCNRNNNLSETCNFDPVKNHVLIYTKTRSGANALNIDSDL